MTLSLFFFLLTPPHTPVTCLSLQWERQRKTSALVTDQHFRGHRDSRVCEADFCWTLRMTLVKMHFSPWRGRRKSLTMGVRFCFVLFSMQIICSEKSIFTQWEYNTLKKRDFHFSDCAGFFFPDNCKQTHQPIAPVVRNITSVFHNNINNNGRHAHYLSLAV